MFWRLHERHMHDDRVEEPAVVEALVVKFVERRFNQMACFRCCRIFTQQ